LVNTTPALLALRTGFPEATIAVECGAAAVGVLENFPGLDEVWPRPKHQGALGKLRAIRTMRRGRFDLAVALDDSHDLMLHARLAGIPLRVGVWRGRKLGGCYSAAVPFAPSGHELRDNLRLLLDLIGAPIGDTAPALFPSESDRQTARSVWTALELDGQRVAAIHPGASEPKKRWPPDRWAETARRLSADGLRTLLLVGPGEDSLRTEVLAHDRGNLVALERPLSVLQLACVLDRCSVALSGDTGPMHVAAAMGTPVVAVFGPTDPERHGPAGSAHIVMRGACTCVPRSLEVCSHACMLSIQPEDVARAAAAIVRHPQRAI